MRSPAGGMKVGQCAAPARLHGSNTGDGRLDPCPRSPAAAHLASRRQDREAQGACMAATRIDCDIHPAVGGTRTTLLPYLDDHWKEQVVSRAIDGLDLNSYPPNMPLSGRADWRPDDGSKPGSDLAMVQRGAFDQLGAATPSATCSTARRPCSIPTWRPTSARRSTTGSRPNGCQGHAAARLHRGADAGAGSRARGDRAPRVRQSFRLHPGAGAGRDAARPPALLAGLPARREIQAAARDPCRQRLSHGAELDRLAVVPLRILFRRGAGVSGADPEPDL